LLDYPGTILFVSHDRYFINRIASKVVELNKDGATEYLGDYDYFVEKKLEQEELKALAENNQANVNSAKQEMSSYQQDKEAKKLERQRLRRIEKIEEEIENLEQSIEKNDQLLCEPEIFQDHEKSLEILQENEQMKLELEKLMEEWTLLADE